MQNFIEIKPPRPKPKTLAQWKPYLDLMLQDLDRIKSNPYPMPIDNLKTKFEEEVDETNDGIFEDDTNSLIDDFLDQEPDPTWEVEDEEE